MTKSKNGSGSKSKFAAKFLADYDNQYPRLAVRLKTEKGGYYPDHLTIEVSVVELDDKDQDGFKLCGSYHRESVDGLELQGFVDAANPTALYTGIYFSGGRRVGLAELKQKTVALTWIEAGLQKLRDQFGCAESWGSFVARFATVIGAEALVLERTSASREISGERYRICRASDIQGVVNATVLTFIESRRPVPEQQEPAAV